MFCLLPSLVFFFVFFLHLWYHIVQKVVMAASSSTGRAAAEEGKGEGSRDRDREAAGGGDVGGEVSPSGKGRISKKRPRQEESGSPDQASMGRLGGLRCCGCSCGRLDGGSPYPFCDPGLGPYKVSNAVWRTRAQEQCPMVPPDNKTLSICMSCGSHHTNQESTFPEVPR